MPIPSLQEQPERHEWFPLLNYVNPKKLAKDIKTKRETVGEVRLNVKYHSNKAKQEDKPKGIVIEGEWTKETSGGTLNHGTWWKNKQYLLEIKEELEINIALTSKKTSDTTTEELRASFYLIKYNEKYNGREVVLYDIEDVIKLDSFWAPLFSEQPKSNHTLEAGEYVIIPTTELPGMTGLFTLNVWSSKQSLQSSIQLEKLPVENKKWNVVSYDGKWTKETSGGGDIANSLLWRKNPQYLLTLEKDCKRMCIQLSQLEKDNSIGIYLIPYTFSNFNKKELLFKNDIYKTDSFKYQPTVGFGPCKLANDMKYIIIPCTNKPKTAEYTLNVFSEVNITVTPITNTWNTIKSIKCDWKSENELAGGSPNNKSTFLSNPQFAFTVTGSTKCLIELSVTDISDAIGFIVVKSKFLNNNQLN